MSFGDGVNPSRVAELETQVNHLKDVNGKLCAEINRQERVIEELRANAARLVSANDAMAERIRKLESSLEHKSINLVLHEGTIDELESLVCDMYEEFRYTPLGYQWDAIEQFGKRMRELGIEACK